MTRLKFISIFGNKIYKINSKNGIREFVFENKNKILDIFIKKIENCIILIEN